MLKEKIIEILKNDDKLRQLNQEYKGKELTESKDDKELIQNLFENLKRNDNIKHLLSNIKGLYSFSQSQKSVHSTQSENKNKKKEQIPKLQRFPSYFKISNIKENDSKYYKAISLNSRGTIVFETNAEDEFLTRNVEKGELVISVLNYGNNGQGGGSAILPSKPQEKLVISRSGPTDGEIRLSIAPTDKAAVGDMFEISAKMISAGGELEVIVFVGIEDKKNVPKKPKNTQETPNLNLPKMIRVFKEQKENGGPIWSECKPPMTADDIVQLVISDEGDSISEILINMDSNLIKKQINKSGVSVEKVGKKYVANIYSHALILYSTLYGYYSQNLELDIDKRALDTISEDLNNAVSKIFQYYGGFLMDISNMDLFDD